MGGSTCTRSDVQMVKDKIHEAEEDYINCSPAVKGFFRGRLIGMLETFYYLGLITEDEFDQVKERL